MAAVPAGLVLARVVEQKPHTRGDIVVQMRNAQSAAKP